MMPIYTADTLAWVWFSSTANALIKVRPLLKTIGSIAATHEDNLLTLRDQNQLHQILAVQPQLGPSPGCSLCTILPATNQRLHGIRKPDCFQRYRRNPSYSASGQYHSANFRICHPQCIVSHRHRRMLSRWQQ